MEVEHIDINNELSQIERELLLNGYHNDKQKQIPKDIVFLLLAFCGNLHHDQWIFNEHQINEWFSMEPGHCLVNNRTIDIDDLKLQYIIYPNGTDTKQYNKYLNKGYVQFLVKVKRFSPVTIKSITIYYELYCFELGKIWKNTACFNKKEEIKWGRYNMKLSECKNQQRLTFGCFIDVIDITYNPYNIVIDKNQKLWVKDIKMHQKFKFKWSLNPEWLIYGDKDTYFFDNFNNGTFCLYYSPKWYRYTLGIKLLSLPHSIGSIDIDYKINNGWRDSEYRSQWMSIKGKGQRYSSECSIMYQCRHDRIQTSYLKNEVEDEGDVEIEIILKALCFDGSHHANGRIPREQWHQHGIILTNMTNNESTN